MAFQTKTLIKLVPAVLLIMAFQNCAPQKFSQTNAASEKTLVDDGTSPDVDVPADDSSDQTTDDSANPPKTGDNGGPVKLPNVPVKTPDGSKDPVKQNPDAKRAANCKELSAKFVAMKIKPANLPKIRTSGQTSAGPFYVSGVAEIESTGSSDVYVVGSDANAMAKEIRASGLGHVVLCGVYAGNTRVSGQGVVDVIGANVLGEVKPSGQGQVNVLDQDGNPL